MVATNHSQKVLFSLLNRAIADDPARPSRSLKLFLSENKCRLLFQSLIKSPGDLTKDDIAGNYEGHFQLV